MIAIALAALASFAIAAALGRPLIGALRRAAARQTAYEDAPATHQTKTGTPTMGGVLFLAAPLVVLALGFAGGRPTRASFALALLVALCAAIGAVDDLASIRQRKNRGLRARTKFALTALAGVAFLAVAGGDAAGGASLLGIGAIPLGAWWVLSLCVILATTHAVNLTDGLDGLAGGTILPPLAVIAVLAYRAAQYDVGAFAGATAGAVLGFLIYNRHPARMFMGDTGSLALGGALAGCAILGGAQLLLLLIGGVFAAETLSVIIQVASFKSTGRRVFRMSPLHHHFELGGWPETTVTRRFWLASFVLSALGLAIVIRA